MEGSRGTVLKGGHIGMLSAVVTGGDKNPSSGNGSVSGTVKDASGAVLPGAQIVLQLGAITAAANAQGEFVIQDPVAGNYRVTISDVSTTPQRISLAHSTSAG